MINQMHEIEIIQLNRYLLHNPSQRLSKSMKSSLHKEKKNQYFCTSGQ